MFRNLMAMDVEEMIRAQPMDAVVLIGGCDKTVPAQLMGAASAGRARRSSWSTGPMMTGLAPRRARSAPAPTAGASGRSYRAGEVDADEIDAIEGNLATTAGTCAVMGTAQHHGRASPRRWAWRCPAPRRSPPCTPTACAPPRRPARARSRLIARADPAERRSSRRSRSRTRCACCWRSAARPTRIVHLTAIAGPRSASRST